MLPDVTIQVQDGALGVIDASSERTHLKIGTSSAGTANVPVLTQDINTVKNTFGAGPLVEAAAYALAQPGAGPVLLVKAPSTAPTTPLTAVTKTGTGTGTVTVAGTPSDDYQAQAVLVAGGTNIAAATATFQYSLDGGKTFSPVLSVPTSGTYLIPGTGITLTFVNGGSGTSFVAGDVHSFTATAPTYTTSDLVTALNAALNSQNDFGFVHAVGAAADAAGAAAVFAAIDSALGTAFNAHRYLRAIMELPDVSDATLTAQFSTLASTRVSVAGGYANIQSAASGTQQKRPAGWVQAARAGAVDLMTDLARVKDGPVQGVTALFRDERVTQGFDNARFTSLRSWVRKPGYYITNARLLSSPGSDYDMWQLGRIMDVACAVTYDGLVEYLSDNLEVDKATGKLTEVEARRIEAGIAAKLRSRLMDAPKRVSSITVQIDRTTNVLSTKSLSATTRLVPLLYPKTISESIGYTNPALVLS